MSCATRMRDGINADAGGIVERAVVLALRYLEDSVTRHPDLDQHPMCRKDRDIRGQDEAIRGHLGDAQGRTQSH